MKQNPREEREHALRAFNALPMEARLGLMEEAQRIADDLEVPEEQITFESLENVGVTLLMDLLRDIDARLEEHITPEALNQLMTEEHARIAKEHPEWERIIPHEVLQVAVWERVKRDVFPNLPTED